MTTYAIGDVQGCYEPLQRLLEKLRFDPSRDRLWFCGDLVNRGGQSLEVLRLVKSLDAYSITVLGNHDLSLLAVGERSGDDKRKVNEDLQRVVFAEDGTELLSWLRQRPLFHADRDIGFAMVHAGLAANWTIAEAEKRAEEVHKKLRGKDYRRLLSRMYGNRPGGWHSNLVGTDRLRAIINCMTRMRYCDVRGRIAFDQKGSPGTQKPGLYPWFSVPGKVPRELPIVIGHWSSLGLFQGVGVHALDTGCVWGGNLTALALQPEPFIVSVPGMAKSDKK